MKNFISGLFIFILIMVALVAISYGQEVQPAGKHRLIEICCPVHGHNHESAAEHSHIPGVKHSVNKWQISAAPPVLPMLPVVNDGKIKLPQWNATYNWGQNWVTGSFAPGDTIEVITGLSQIRAFYFQTTDSSLTGTDTIVLVLQNTSNVNTTQRSILAVHNLNTSTITTYVTIMVAASLTSTYVWYPCNVADCYFTGTLAAIRTNVNDNVTPYLPVTRFQYNSE